MYIGPWQEYILYKLGNDAGPHARTRLSLIESTAPVPVETGRKRHTESASLIETPATRTVSRQQQSRSVSESSSVLQRIKNEMHYAPQTNALPCAQHIRPPTRGEIARSPAASAAMMQREREGHIAAQMDRLGQMRRMYGLEANTESQPARISSAPAVQMVLGETLSPREGVGHPESPGQSKRSAPALHGSPLRTDGATNTPRSPPRLDIRLWDAARGHAGEGGASRHGGLPVTEPRHGGLPVTEREADLLALLAQQSAAAAAFASQLAAQAASQAALQAQVEALQRALQDRDRGRGTRRPGDSMLAGAEVGRGSLQPWSPGADPFAALDSAVEDGVDDVNYDDGGLGGMLPVGLEEGAPVEAAPHVKAAPAAAHVQSFHSPPREVKGVALPPTSEHAAHRSPPPSRSGGMSGAPSFTSEVDRISAMLARARQRNIKTAT